MLRAFVTSRNTTASISQRSAVSKPGILRRGAPASADTSSLILIGAIYCTWVVRDSDVVGLPELWFRVVARKGFRTVGPAFRQFDQGRYLGNSRPGLNQSLWDAALLSGTLRRRLSNSHTGATEMLGMPVWRVPRAAGSRMPKASLISIVEDDPFFRESMRRFMRSLGYAAEAFPSAADFLASPRLAETGMPDR